MATPRVSCVFFTQLNLFFFNAKQGEWGQNSSGGLFSPTKQSPNMNAEISTVLKAITDTTPPEKGSPKYKVVIVNSRLVEPTDGSGSFTVYVVEVQRNNATAWTVYRRYSEFHALNRHMQARFPYRFVFPPKGTVAESMNDTFSKNRFTMLQNYVKDISDHSPAMESEPVQTFLDPRFNPSVGNVEKPVKSGWMVKRGGFIKTWKTRWMVLNATHLFYFVNPAATSPKGVIALAFYRVGVAPTVRKFCLELFPDPDYRPPDLAPDAPHSPPTRSYFVAAETYGDMVRWAKLLTALTSWNKDAEAMKKGLPQFTANLDVLSQMGTSSSLTASSRSGATTSSGYNSKASSGSSAFASTASSSAYSSGASAASTSSSSAYASAASAASNSTYVSGNSPKKGRRASRGSQGSKKRGAGRRGSRGSQGSRKGGGGGSRRSTRNGGSRRSSKGSNRSRGSRGAKGKSGDNKTLQEFDRTDAVHPGEEPEPVPADAVPPAWYSSVTSVDSTPLDRGRGKSRTIRPGAPLGAGGLTKGLAGVDDVDEAELASVRARMRRKKSSAATPAVRAITGGMGLLAALASLPMVREIDESSDESVGEDDDE